MFSQEVIDSKVVENSDAATGSQIGVVTVSTVHMAAHDFTQNPLRRSVSQLIDRKAGEGQDDVWDPHFRAHDSGMVRNWIKIKMYYITLLHKHIIYLMFIYILLYIYIYINLIYSIYTCPFLFLSLQV